MKKAKAAEKLQKLREAALDDLMSLSDDELRQEMLEDGENIQAVEQRMRAAVEDGLATARRRRLEGARTKIRANTSNRILPASRPPAARLKELVMGALMGRPDLKLAFREGKKQTEEDLQSLYDDLIALGAIEPEDSGN